MWHARARCLYPSAKIWKQRKLQVPLPQVTWHGPLLDLPVPMLDTCGSEQLASALRNSASRPSVRLSVRPRKLGSLRPADGSASTSLCAGGVLGGGCGPSNTLCEASWVDSIELGHGHGTAPHHAPCVVPRLHHHQPPRARMPLGDRLVQRWCCHYSWRRHHFLALQQGAPVP